MRLHARLHRRAVPPPDLSRGVGVDTIMKTLTDLGLVRLVGRSELPGHPFLYGTTPFFLEHFGLASLDQLNEIDPTLPRSNPRERAKLFKREEKPAVEQPELTEAVAAEEAASADGAEATSAEAEAKDENAAAADEEVTVADGEASAVDDDDDIFIDDTPDEFDDEDDDDEDDEEEEDGELEEDEDDES